MTSDLVPAECGTYAGYNRHYRFKDLPPCMPCEAAQAVYIQDWRVRAGRTRSTLVPYALLAESVGAHPRCELHAVKTVKAWAGFEAAEKKRATT